MAATDENDMRMSRILAWYVFGFLVLKSILAAAFLISKMWMQQQVEIADGIVAAFVAVLIWLSLVVHRTYLRRTKSVE